MAKVQISIDDKLLERIDKYADNNYTSRSGLISLGMAEYLNSREVIGLVKDMSLAVRKIADNSVVDDKTMEQLADFERTCKMLTGQ